MEDGDIMEGETGRDGGGHDDCCSGLAILETTIGNSNPDLWQFLTPKSVLEVSWQILR